MMIGTVSGRHALLPVVFRLPGQAGMTIEFVVDTGYTDYLTLPPSAVVAMGLRYLHHTKRYFIGLRFRLPGCENT